MASLWSVRYGLHLGQCNLDSATLNEKATSVVAYECKMEKLAHRTNCKYPDLRNSRIEADGFLPAIPQLGFAACIIQGWPMDFRRYVKRKFW